MYHLVKLYVGGDCYHTILTSNRQFNLTSLIDAMAIAPYGVFEDVKHYNRTIQETP